MPQFNFDALVNSSDPASTISARAFPARAGTLPHHRGDAAERPSGDLFGLTQDAGMGWDPRKLGGPEILLLSTHGGIRAPDGTPIALGLSHRTLGSRAADGSGRAAN